MPCTRLKPFLFLSTLLFVFSAFFSSSHEAHQNRGLRISENGHDFTSTIMRRHVLEATNAQIKQNTSLILAAERTHRKDPLDGFKYYKGGWNISETHYYASVGFTAAPLFIIAATWFLGFGLCLLVIGFCHCCRQPCDQNPSYSQTAYWISLIYIVLFTIASIIGCVVLYMGQGKFHSEATNTLDYVVRQADSVVKSLDNITHYLDDAKSIEIDQISLPQNVQRNIESVEKKINASSTLLKQVTQNNSDGIQQVFDYVRLSLIIVSAVMLLLTFLGFLFSVMGKQRVVYILVVIGWILVTATFILGGTLLLLHNVVGDTCVAMEDWVQNPTAKSALDDILPCVGNATAQEALYETKDVTSQLVGVANFFITNISNANVPPKAPNYYNQSGPPVPILCDPFHSDPPKTDRKCADGELNFDDAPKGFLNENMCIMLLTRGIDDHESPPLIFKYCYAQEWRQYICQVSESGICTTVGRLSPQFYDQLTAISNVGSVMYSFGPFLVDLGDCTFVRRTFNDISGDHCPGLRRNSRLIVIGLALVSASVMFSLIFWVFFARERRHYRGHTKHEHLEDESA